MIAVDGVRKQFGGRQVLDGVSFHVEAGETLGLVGSLGSGKSTVLRILATLDRADEGSATVDGVPVDRDPDMVRRLVGYLPERCGAYRRMTAREHLEFYAGVHGVPAARRRTLAEELLEVLALADHADDEVATLTRGGQRRLDLARTLVHDPAVLLLDEPDTGLDPDSQREVRTLVTELAAMGKTMIVAGRALDDVAAMCSSLGLLEDGRVTTAGPVAEVRDEVAEHLRRKLPLAQAAGTQQ